MSQEIFLISFKKVLKKGHEIPTFVLTVKVNGRKRKIRLHTVTRSYSEKSLLVPKTGVKVFRGLSNIILKEVFKAKKELLEVGCIVYFNNNKISSTSHYFQRQAHHPDAVANAIKQQRMGACE